MEKSGLFRYMTADEVIVRQGDKEKALYKVIHGQVIVYLNYGKSDEHVVGVISKDGCFGELSILCGSPQPYTVVAYGDGMLMRVAEENFDSFIQNNIQNVKAIMRNLGNALIRSNKNLELLLDDIKNFGKPQADTIQRAALLLRQYAHSDTIQGKHFSSTV